VGALLGELLGDDSAEGDADDVDLCVSDLGEHGAHRSSDAGHASRDPVLRGPSDTRGVKADHSVPESHHAVFERPTEIDGGAETGDEQDGPAGASDGGAEPNLLDVDEGDGLLVRRRHRHR
jgi:hypothetical protein